MATVAIGCLLSILFLTAGGTAYAEEPIINLDEGPFETKVSPDSGGPALLERLYTEHERALGVRTNILPDGAVEAGPVVRVRPGVPASDADQSIINLGGEETWDVGGYVGYRFSEVGGADSSLGVNLQMLGDPTSSESPWAMTPGIDYSTALDQAWRIDARVFSSYGRESGALNTGGTGDLSAGVKSRQEPGFQDFGFSLGLGYSVADQLSISTSAGYARARQGGPETSTREDAEWAGEFFGGVMLNYRF